MPISTRLWRVATIIGLAALCLAACAAPAGPALIGTWTSTVTKQDILRVVPDFQTPYLCENSGTFVWKFAADGKFAIDQTSLPDCPTPGNPHVEATWVIDGNLVTFAKGTPDQETYEWSVTGDTLTFKYR